ncbi:MAG: TerB family tellurite resistance protein [Gloeomargarita sp. HHBFW_bins_162]
MSAIPSISPRQMNLLRVVAAMSWSDGELSAEESTLILDRFSQLFAQNEQQQAQLRQELEDYVTQNIPLEELVPKLHSDTEKFLVLQLGYAVIKASSRAPGEPLVNEDEKAAYTKLINLLGIPPEQVRALEAEMDAQLQNHNVVDAVVDTVNHYLQQNA